jgi:beta-phosphoglucomutase-like phosphatase (HAD superfamily)
MSQRAATATIARVSALAAAARPTRHSLDLDRLAAGWQLALDAAQSALDCSGHTLPAAELQKRQSKLGEERRRTATLLESVARVEGAKETPWLSAVPVAPRLLGLDAGVAGCIFDLDGVLTDSGRAHAAAWADVFDTFLLRQSEVTGLPFVPFDRDTDYRSYVDGRPRLEGIHVFLASRGIRLPEGRPDDPAEADSAYGLARRKGDALARVLQRRGVTALAGARRYLEAAQHAGLPCAVVSGSQNAVAMLEHANLSTLVEATVDAAAIRSESLRSRPAPDVLVAACHELGIEETAGVTFTHTADGVAAGHAAGLGVVGVGDPETLERLRGFGAERTVPALSALLDPRLADRDQSGSSGTDKSGTRE